MTAVVLVIVVSGGLAGAGYWLGYGHGCAAGFFRGHRLAAIKGEPATLPVCDHLEGVA